MYLCGYVQRCKCLRALLGDGPSHSKDKVKRKTVCKGTADLEGGERGRKKKQKINEWVCCDSGSHTGTIITIHQDNE